jgi:hypothetical protein
MPGCAGRSTDAGITLPCSEKKTDASVHTYIHTYISALQDGRKIAYTTNHEHKIKYAVNWKKQD